MPKKRPPSTLENLLSHILQRAVHEIAGAIREAGVPSVTAAPVAASPAAPGPKKTSAKKPSKAPAKKPGKAPAKKPGQPPLDSPAPATPAASAAPAPTKAAPAKGTTRKRATTRAGVNPLEKVLLVIRAEPGLRAEQIERLAELPKAAVQAALVTLRKDGRVKVQGKARGTTYAAA